MKKLNTKGFGILQVLLLLVIVGMIAGVGYYVYTSQKKTNTALDNAANSQADPQKSEKKEEVEEEEKEDETTDWTTYSFKKANTSIKLPDGWDVSLMTGNEMDLDLETLYIIDASNIVYESGTRATVTDNGYKNLEGEKGSLFIYFTSPQPFGDKETFEQRTASGNKIDKYVYVSTTDPEGLGSYEKGTKVISYFTEVSGKTLMVRYIVNPGDGDQTKYVEKMLSTLN